MKIFSPYSPLPAAWQPRLLRSRPLAVSAPIFGCWGRMTKLWSSGFDDPDVTNVACYALISRRPAVFRVGWDLPPIRANLVCPVSLRAL